MQTTGAPELRGRHRAEGYRGFGQRPAAEHAGKACVANPSSGARQSVGADRRRATAMRSSDCRIQALTGDLAVTLAAVTCIPGRSPRAVTLGAPTALLAPALSWPRCPATA